MKLSLVSLAIAVAAILLTVLRPTSSAPAPRETAAVEPGADDLRGEIAALRAENAELQARLDEIAMRQELLERRPAAAETRREPVPSGDEIAVDEKLRQLVAALENPALAPASGIESLVLDVLETKEQQEEYDRAERRRQLTEERVQERVLELTEQLGLDSRQANEMHRVLTEEQLGREKLFLDMRDDGVFDRRTMRDGMREIRETTHTELQAILSPGQLEDYESLEERRFFGGPPGGPFGSRDRSAAGRDAGGTEPPRGGGARGGRDG